MKPKKPLLILKTGSKIDSLHDVSGDYEHWIAAGMGWESDQVRVVDTTVDSLWPEPRQIAGVAITGSGSMVTEQATWMLRATDWLADAVHQQVPILGICFGHQLLAHALGGRVDFNPRGVEVGTVSVSLAEAAAGDPLLSGLPPRFSAQLSHRQSVLELPPGAVLLGASDMEPHQGFSFGPRAWGIQFHPEFDDQIVARFIEDYRDILAGQGQSADALHSGIRPAPESHSVLRRFARIVRREPA